MCQIKNQIHVQHTFLTALYASISQPPLATPDMLKFSAEWRVSDATKNGDILIIFGNLYLETLDI